MSLSLIVLEKYANSDGNVTSDINIRFMWALGSLVFKEHADFYPLGAPSLKFDI